MKQEFGGGGIFPVNVWTSGNGCCETRGESGLVLQLQCK